MFVVDNELRHRFMRPEYLHQKRLRQFAKNEVNVARSSAEQQIGTNYALRPRLSCVAKKESKKKNVSLINRRGAGR